MPRRAASLRVEGRVQGVGYRWWAVQTARRLGLEGWVRNRADGSVEILAIGEAEALEEFAAACRGGSSGAVVASVTATPAEDDGSVGFEQRATL
jgi:acylphosphatase